MQCPRKRYPHLRHRPLRHQTAIVSSPWQWQMTAIAWSGAHASDGRGSGSPIPPRPRMSKTKPHLVGRHHRRTQSRLSYRCRVLQGISPNSVRAVVLSTYRVTAPAGEGGMRRAHVGRARVPWLDQKTTCKRFAWLDRPPVSKTPAVYTPSPANPWAPCRHPPSSLIPKS